MPRNLNENFPLLVKNTTSTFEYNSLVDSVSIGNSVQRDSKFLAFCTVLREHRCKVVSTTISGILLLTLILTLAFTTSISSDETPIVLSSTLLKQNVPETDTVVSENIVTIAQGQLEPLTLKSRDGRDYYGFYKIPYAEPPVGRRRFKSPEEPTATWSGIRKETQAHVGCLQPPKSSKDPKIITGEEDCLFLNVFSPQVGAANPKPVMVWIFGGGMRFGNGSSYDGVYLMDYDVVYVNLNYRLGPLGYLTTGDSAMDDNVGFKDCVMALKWVQKNIAQFGGDPNSVTIFGNSAGGMIVSALMLSPMATGFFHKAISQSGHPSCPFATQQVPLRNTELIAKEFNCSTRSTRRLVRCLRQIDAAALVGAESPSEDGTTLPYAVIVEKAEDQNDLTNVFLPDAPLALYKSGRVNKVPWMTGITNSEQLRVSLGILLNVSYVNDLNNNWTLYAPKEFMYQSEAIDSDKMSLDVRRYYFDSRMISNETERILTNLCSDRNNVHCTHLSAKLQAAFSDVYAYYFTKVGPKSHADKQLKEFSERPFGTAHGDELQFIFPYRDFPYIGKDSPNYNFSKQFLKVWTSFARTGRPFSPGSEWVKVSPENKDVSWYHIGDEFKPLEDPEFLARMEFWDQYSPDELFYK